MEYLNIQFVVKDIIRCKKKQILKVFNNSTQINYQHFNTVTENCMS